MKKLMILLAVVAMGAMLCAQERQVVDGIVAVVDKNIIRHSDIEQAYTQIRLHQGVQNAHEERCKLLESMLVNKMLLHKGIQFFPCQIAPYRFFQDRGSGKIIAVEDFMKQHCFHLHTSFPFLQSPSRNG